MIKVILILIFVLINQNLSHADNYYDQHAVGWHWYDDPTEEKQEKTNYKPVEQNPNIIINSAKEKITTALNKAIAEPTLENVENYIALQEQLNNRAEKVANLWQAALLKNPAINYALTHPTNNIGLQVYHEEISEKKEKAIKLFANSTGLFFFYSSTCPYCRRFSPILKKFAASYGITIIPITLDGISLPEFPQSKQDTGQAAQFHVKVTPALFAVNPYTKKAFPVAYGLTSETELRDNIYNIMTRYGDSEHAI
jgi:conjugal transfer pilus assembly protein TraF